MECLQKKLLLEFESVKKNIFLKVVTPFQMVLFQPKEMFCRLLHERNWQTRAAAALLQMNYMSVGSTEMFIASV